MTVRRVVKIVCDGCLCEERYGGTCTTPNEIRHLASMNGWRQTLANDYCSTCAASRNPTKKG